MKIFVTGASGLLGQAVIKRLSSENHEVRALFHHNQPKDEEIISQVEVFWGDINSPETYANFLKGCDVLIHCAWDSSKRQTSEEYFATNVRSASELVRAAQDLGVNNIITLSSIGVYGYEMPTHMGDYTERDGVEYDDSSIEYFASTKRDSENELFEISRERPLNLTILRAGNLYSDEVPPMNSATLGNISLFAGFGNNHLPYIHVDSVAELISEIVRNPSSGIQIVNAVPPHSDTARATFRRWKMSHETSRRVIYMPVPVYRAGAFVVSFLKSVFRKGELSSSAQAMTNNISRNVGYSAREAHTKYGWMGY